MARLPDKLLEHPVVIRPALQIPASNGAKYGAAVNRMSITNDKATKVTDQREDTKGEEVIASSIVLVQPEHYVRPGSLVTVWPGMPYERTGEVVATSIGKHSIAWESCRLWIV